MSGEGGFIILEINGNEYRITGADRFLDDGFVLKLQTQTKERCDISGGCKPPVLPERAVRQIRKYKIRVHQQRGSRHRYRIFSLVIPACD